MGRNVQLAREWIEKDKICFLQAKKGEGQRNGRRNIRGRGGFK